MKDIYLKQIQAQEYIIDLIESKIRLYEGLPSKSLFQQQKLKNLLKQKEQAVQSLEQNLNMKIS